MALRFLNLDIDSRAKIGIFGRTGAGKSSLVKSLLRIVEVNTGRILIDGVDVSKLSLFALRSNITVIPQTPFLFEGTIRENLDPHGSSDLELWEALEEVELAEFVGRQERDLDQPCSEAHFSQGQKQLLCLARARLERNQIVVMDEPTANIDEYTDELIQKAIRKCFKNCTVLTIAHRLNSLVDNDLVIRLDRGRIEESSSPDGLAFPELSVGPRRSPQFSSFRKFSDKFN